MLNNRKAHNEQVSKYSVNKTIKSKLRFSYKKVGSRSPKALHSEFSIARKHYWILIKYLDDWNYVLNQIDEFWICYNFLQTIHGVQKELAVLFNSINRVNQILLELPFQNEDLSLPLYKTALQIRIFSLSS